MNLFPLNNQSIWKDLWLNQLKNDPEKTKNKSPNKKWDKRAQVFDKRSATPQAVARKERILSMLKKAGCTSTRKPCSGCRCRIGHLGRSNGGNGSKSSRPGTFRRHDRNP